MIKYLGSKRRLLPQLLQAIGARGRVRRVLDVFSGTARVGHACKAAGWQVVACDHNAYAATLATCYVQADRERWETPASQLIAELNALPGHAGYFTETFCQRARYLQPKNGERVDAMREAIARKGLEPELEAIVLTALMEAADRVDSTTGVQMAYLKQWSARSHNGLSLRLPALLPVASAGAGVACQMDALQAAERFEADVAYLDPPYNQHSYLGNYHVWESLVRWDKPEVYGVACKRIDCRERRSPFNQKTRAKAALAALIGALQARTLVVSFSNEGFLSQAELQAMLATRGTVQLLEVDSKRYVGAQIGIHNPQGEKVGKVSHLTNREWIFVVDCDGTAIA